MYECDREREREKRRERKRVGQSMWEREGEREIVSVGEHDRESGRDWKWEWEWVRYSLESCECACCRISQLLDGVLYHGCYLVCVLCAQFVHTGWLCWSIGASRWKVSLFLPTYSTRPAKRPSCRPALWNLWPTLPRGRSTTRGRLLYLVRNNDINLRDASMFQSSRPVWTKWDAVTVIFIIKNAIKQLWYTEINTHTSTFIFIPIHLYIHTYTLSLTSSLSCSLLRTHSHTYTLPASPYSLALTHLHTHTHIPGMPYLDVIRRLRDASSLPIAAYQVSGEYAMLKAAAQKVRTCLCVRVYVCVYVYVYVYVYTCTST